MPAVLRIALPVPVAAAQTTYGNYFETLSAMGATGVAVDADVDPSAFDGLLLPGGWDVDPARYGRRNVACEGVDAALDERQFRALEAFIRAGKPVLAICRGHQLVNVCFGGTLIQHLPQSDVHSRGASDADKVHGTHAEPGSVLCALYGDTFAVNSSHHQAVDKPGEGLRIIQRSDDGVVEGMAHGRLPILCVQWHPERMCLRHARADTVDGAALFRWFLARCAEK